MGVDRNSAAFLWFSACALSVVLGCSKEAPPAEEAPDAAALPASAAQPSDEPSTPKRHASLLPELAGCDVYHRGAFIDLAGKDVAARRGFTLASPEESAQTTGQGSRFTRIHASKVSFDFWLDAELESPFIELRGAAGSISSAGVYLNDRYVTTARFGKEMSAVRSRALEQTLKPGRHVVTLNLRGKSSSQGRIDLDWVRLGAPDDLKATFTPLREGDILRDVALQDVPRRAIALPAPSAVRCPMWIAERAKLRVQLGVWGNGRGEAELRLLQDGKQPVILHRRKLNGEEGAPWVPVEVDLSEYGSRLVALEFRAALGESSGRIVFGDPEIQVESASAEVKAPEANTVVIVVMSGMDRRRLPPFSPPRGLPALAELTRVGVTFTSYRMPTTIGSASMASLLSGLSPRAHGVESVSSGVPEQVRTVAELFKHSGGRTAMFTGVPTSFKAFGFDRGWDRFDEISPVKDLAASEPTSRASRWLEQQLDKPGKQLVVIHQRGGHPPWDLDNTEIGALPPAEYGGALRARRGAIVLKELRDHRRASARRLSPEDWQRLHAMHDAALLKQDAELARLFSMLKKKNAYDNALIIVAGDMPLSDPPEIPYGPAPALREDRLLAPLYVKFPQSKNAGLRVSQPTTAVDIASTLLATFGIEPLRPLEGVDLFQTALGFEPVLGRPLEATFGHYYASRLGLLMLSGELGKRPRLCELDVDPVCVSDAFEARPIAARALWRATYQLEQGARRRAQLPAAVELNSDTAAALTVWGH